MKEWKSVELAVFASELYLKHLSSVAGVSIHHDVTLKDPDGDRRQFDVLACDEHGEVFRVYEVQDRVDRLGKPELGQFIDKMQEVGVGRLTTVTTSGYATTALRRIVRDERVTALQLIEPAKRYEDVKQFDVWVDLGDQGAHPIAGLNIDFRSASLVDVTTSDVLLDIIYGPAEDESEGWSFFAALTEIDDSWSAATVITLSRPHDLPPEPEYLLVLHIDDGTSVSLRRNTIREQGPL